MADVRCPMCSTLNPEGRDICKFCGARLTPLTSEIAAGNIESIHPGEEPTKKSTAELEHALPDWLQELRKKQETGELQAPKPSEVPAAPPVSSAETDEDFLSRLATESDQGVTPSVQSESTDWLAGLSASKEGEEDIPDWLLGVRKSVEEEAQAAKLSAASQPAPDGSLDWFTRLQEDQKAVKGEASSQWPGFYGEPPGFGKLAPDETPSAKAESADWFMPGGGENTPDAIEPTPSTGVTDWLQRLKAQEGKPAAAEPPTPAPAEAGSLPSSSGRLPDWLSFKQTTPPATEAPAPSAAPAAPGELPDWLSGFQAEQPPVAEIPAPAATAGPLSASSQALPDWLLAAQAEQPAASDITPSQPSQDKPDWLTAFESDQPPAESVPAKATSDQGLPDWLTAAAAGAVAAGALTPKEEKASDLTGGFGEVPASPAAQPASQAFISSSETFSLDEGVPDWLSELPGAQKPAGAAPQQPVAPAPTAGEKPAAEKSEIPDWLVGATASATAAKAASVFTEQSPTAGEEAFAMEMPDWLSSVKPAEASAVALPAQGEPGAGAPESLTPGELPSWVQAMRPVEAVIFETAGDVEDEQFIESQGPLAGFQNVLPFVPGLIAIRRPAPYSSKLQVNTGQQNNAALLEGLLSSESDAARVKPDSSLRYNRFLRWMIAALLIVMVVIPIVLGSQLTPVNSLFPPDLLAAEDVINKLPADPNVLVVFDYEPAFSGEMGTASAPVLDQLMAKGADLTVVTSLPTGSVQANQLLATLLRSFNYLAGNKYVNLGYLPGGAAGIYNFATNPSGTLPTDVEGNQVWSTPGSFLSDTRQLSDFDAMLILVDSSETAQVWVEQSRLPLGTTPLLMVISAQSEPMVRPYYDSGQVQGMVTGLAGGASYELLTGKPGMGRNYWDAFAVAFFVAEIIVVVGGIWALFAAWQSHRARKEEEA
jgi:hypothetical protein